MKVNYDKRTDELQGVLTLQWLRWLRWTAVLGQTVTVLWVNFGLGLVLPLAPVSGLILFTVLTNVVLHVAPAKQLEKPVTLAAVLATDVVVLTELLQFTGGSHNPFSSFYLVHVALAAVALSPVLTGVVALLCVVGFASLFSAGDAGGIAMDVVCGVGPGMPMELHLKGMLVSFVLTAGCIALFVARLQSALRGRELELARARERSIQQEQFAALATLAAGAAHELGTPIGTMAVAAGEINRVAGECRLPQEVVEDAQLIREEAARCRAILDRLQQTAGDPPRRIELSSLFEEVRLRLGGVERLVQFRPPPAGLAVTSPWEALVQAALSLVRNAVDAAPVQGGVIVEVMDCGGRINLIVTDQGGGMTAAARTHAGEPFFTTKPAGKGMGLGLFLVRIVADRVGGSFHLEDNQPVGTRAILELPAAA